MVKNEVKSETKRKILKPKIKPQVDNKDEEVYEEKAKIKNQKYKQTCFIKESHGKSVFSISFNENFRKSNEPLIMASVGSRFVTFYEILPSNTSNSNNIKFLDIFEDRDEDEEFYCCAWSYYVPKQNRSPNYENDDLTNCIAGQHIVACGGKKGVVRIISPNIGQTLTNLEGHGESVNEVKFHPKFADLLFSFSKDYTIRLWNVWTQVLVSIFGGCEGHRSEILHGDIDLQGRYLLSCGMDHTMKVWKIRDDQKLQKTITKSRNYDRTIAKFVFETDLQHFPMFSSNKIHKNYIDCGRWFGQLILSKSCDGYMTLWKLGALSNDVLPEFNTNTSGTHEEVKESILHQIELNGAEIWYIRFDIEPTQGLIAWGNRRGEIYIWDVKAGQKMNNSIFDVEPTVLNLSSRSSNLVVRQTRFVGSMGEMLFCACDQGSIIRFDSIA